MVADGNCIFGGFSMSEMSKSIVAYRAIKEKIVSGEFPTGTKLVIARIAADLEMSAIPVREAIRRLESDGLVRYDHNLGPQVTQLSAERTREMLEVARVLERTAITLAAPRVTPTTVKTLVDLNNRMATAASSGKLTLFATLNKRFHLKICAACPNSFLREQLSAIWALGVASFEVTDETFANRGQTIIDEHDRLISLLTTSPHDLDEYDDMRALTSPTRLRKFAPSEAPKPAGNEQRATAWRMPLSEAHANPLPVATSSGTSF